MAIRKRLKAILEPVKGTQAATITIPFDVEKAFGSRARIPVRGMINGFAFRSSIFPRGGGALYKEWVKFIEDARRPETRARRITRAVEDVAQGEIDP
jgi:hypothetical protein